MHYFESAIIVDTVRGRPFVEKEKCILESAFILESAGSAESAFILESANEKAHLFCKALFRYYLTLCVNQCI